MTQQALETETDSNRTETAPLADPANFTVPESLESTGTKLVYLYLDATNGGTIDDLRASLGMKTITLFPILQTLASKGLVERDGEQYHLVA